MLSLLQEIDVIYLIAGTLIGINAALIRRLRKQGELISSFVELQVSIVKSITHMSEVHTNDIAAVNHNTKEFAKCLSQVMGDLEILIDELVEDPDGDIDEESVH